MLDINAKNIDMTDKFGGEVEDEEEENVKQKVEENVKQKVVGKICEN